MVSDFLQRLQQRKLVQWALAYIAASFALIQVLDVVAQRFGWPDSLERILILALAIGFFVTLIIAWYHGEHGAQKVNSTEIVILALLLAIGGGLLWRYARVASVSSATTPADVSATPITAKSIAVLPFVNMSGDPKNEYFSDGITEEILNALAQIPDLKVAARTSAFAFKGKEEDLRKVGQVLDVATVLEGSVQRAGDEVRITAQLIDTRNGYHLWSEKYDRKLTSIFAVEDEISNAIADKLRVQITGAGGQTLVTVGTGNSQAHDLYLRGLTLLAARGPGLRDAAAAFQQAVKLDPDYAQAWGALAETELISPSYGLGSTEAALPRAESAVRRALALNPDSASVQVAVANVHVARFEWPQADKAFRRALALAPGDAEAVDQYAQFLLTTGQFEPALHEIDRAWQLDPLSAIIGATRTVFFMALHRDANAVAQIETTLKAHPDFMLAPACAALLDIQQQRYTLAETQLRAFARVLGVDADAMALLARGMADPALRAAALHSLENAPATEFLRNDTLFHAAFLMALGEHERALDQLELYAAGHNNSFGGLLWIGSFDPLRNDPRFKAVLKKMGLPYTPAEVPAP